MTRNESSTAGDMSADAVHSQTKVLASFALAGKVRALGLVGPAPDGGEAIDSIQIRVGRAGRRQQIADNRGLALQRAERVRVEDQQSAQDVPREQAELERATGQPSENQANEPRIEAAPVNLIDGVDRIGRNWLVERDVAVDLERLRLEQFGQDLQTSLVRGGGERIHHTVTIGKVSG